MADRFNVGDVIRMKKPHPCGSCEWEVLRVGADLSGMRTPDHGGAQAGRKEYKRN